MTRVLLTNAGGFGVQQFVPGISNDLNPTDPSYGSSWSVHNFLDADDVRFTGTYADCEAFIAAGLPSR